MKQFCLVKVNLPPHSESSLCCMQLGLMPSACPEEQTINTKVSDRGP